MQKSMYAIRDNSLFLDLAQGPEALSVRELTMLLLITGTTKENILEMTNRIIRDYGERNIFAEKDPEKLSRDLDIPIVKACQIIAAGELGRRHYDKTETGFTTIRNAQDVFDYLTYMRNLPKEHMRGLYLNSHGRIIRDEVISIGTINSNIIHPREVFHPAIASNATAVVIAHNHPSGEATPSAEDIEITKQLAEAGKILGIALLDHVIITKDAFASVNASY
ncbi:MAG: DNA repair protein RadC [Candidatus Taylorbacteria bacterium]|nr:DNA repair protein RadC [Candidatus Taylorbacteria bacterium]